MPTRRTTLPSARGDDATGQAGWMYTDLLLGLVTVFMATVSFLPSALPGLAPSAYTYTQHFDQIFQKGYAIKNVNADVLKADIQDFLNSNGLPASSVVEMVQVIAGYDETSESNTDGINRAVAFSKSFDKSDPELLGKASISVDTNSFLGKENVVIRLKFGAKVR